MAKPSNNKNKRKRGFNSGTNAGFNCGTNEQNSSAGVRAECESNGLAECESGDLARYIELTANMIELHKLQGALLGHMQRALGELGGK